jgi:glycosyltransferase involved in cell wall biosynthesis
MSDVEVLIADNASTDDTPSVIHEYRGRFETIRCCRHESNIEFDRNVDFLVTSADSPYVWTLADDDILVEGALESVKRTLDRFPDASLVFTGTPAQGADYPGRFDGDDFLRLSGFRSGLISNNIFNKKLWRELPMYGFFDSLWIHFAYIIHALPLLPGCIHGKPLIRELMTIGQEELSGLFPDVSHSRIANLRDFHGRWGKGGNFINTGLKLIDLFIDMPNLGYSARTCKMALKVIEGGYWKYIPLAKGSGFSFDRKILHKMVGYYGTIPSFWLIDLPIAALPNFIFKYLLDLARSIKNK